MLHRGVFDNVICTVSGQYRPISPKYSAQRVFKPCKPLEILVFPRISLRLTDLHSVVTIHVLYGRDRISRGVPSNYGHLADRLQAGGV